jgi:hypothetical protein
MIASDPEFAAHLLLNISKILCMRLLRPVRNRGVAAGHAPRRGKPSTRRPAENFLGLHRIAAPRAAEAGHDLVRDQENAVRVA